MNESNRASSSHATAPPAIADRVTPATSVGFMTKVMKVTTPRLRGG
jgi:hypothetical protein